MLRLDQTFKRFIRGDSCGRKRGGSKSNQEKYHAPVEVQRKKGKFDRKRLKYCSKRVLARPMVSSQVRFAHQRSPMSCCAQSWVHCNSEVWPKLQMIGRGSSWGCQSTMPPYPPRRSKQHISIAITSSIIGQIPYLFALIETCIFLFQLSPLNFCFLNL